MKILFIICILEIYTCDSLLAQKSSGDNPGKWKFGTEANFYFTDPFLIMPVLTAEKNNWHFETRYNYEDIKTFSLWSGYKFSGGKKFTYEILPMAGLLAGRINGIAPGLNLDLSYLGFEFFGMSEYVFDLDDSENNYYYSWIDLSYSPLDWLWFGVSGQRTKVRNTSADLEHGLLLGVAIKNFEMNAYYYNPGTDDKYFILTLSVNF